MLHVVSLAVHEPFDQTIGTAIVKVPSTSLLLPNWFPVGKEPESTISTRSFIIVAAWITLCHHLFCWEMKELKFE